MIECLWSWVCVREWIDSKNFVIGKERCIFGAEAFKRIRLGVVIQMTSIGIPMIWMGEEIGE
jgi:1,4-alpha-glucan branching enzyme